MNKSAFCIFEMKAQLDLLITLPGVICADKCCTNHPIYVHVNRHLLSVNATFPLPFSLLMQEKVTSAVLSNMCCFAYVTLLDPTPITLNKLGLSSELHNMWAFEIRQYFPRTAQPSLGIVMLHPKKNGLCLCSLI